MSEKRDPQLIKTNLKLILFPIVVVLLLGGILGYLFVNGQPRTEAAYEQVRQAAKNQGFTPIDTTELFKEAWKDSRSASLKKALTFQSGDTDFNFFIFDSDSSAHSARYSYWYYLRYDSGRFGTKGTNQEYTSSGSNFTICWVKTKEYFTVCTRVGSTVIYAETNADENAPILRLLDEIGYQ